MTSPTNSRAFYAGLACVSLATLSLEVVNARVFSAITWYHLSFFAVSLAMLGMTAGALVVYVNRERFTGAGLHRSLVRASLALALAIPVGHALTLVLRPGSSLHGGASAIALVDLLLLSAVSTVPFFASGVIVAASLTTVALPVGRLYFFDLLGAGAGCLAALGLLSLMDPSSAMLLLGAAAAFGALCYAWGDASVGVGARRLSAALAVALALAGAWNAYIYPRGIRVTYSKGLDVPRDAAFDAWNTHSRVVATQVFRAPPRYWGAGAGAPQVPIDQAFLNIDGEAGTWVTALRAGDLGPLAWVRHDVTSLAYHLLDGGDVAILGVGGGRDVLTALVFGARHVTGVEVNELLVNLLEDRFRALSQIADLPNVELVNAEGRSFLARTDQRFDLIQMSLIDTWAATGAGAMTLSENGLYTVEAWSTFLDRLSPGGVLTVSRWFAPENLGETGRLVSLAVGTLVERGVADPEAHIVLAHAGAVATLIIGASPLSPADVEVLESAAERYGFEVAVAPHRVSSDRELDEVVDADTETELAEAVEHPILDLRPSTDERPFFFNIVRPLAWLTGDLRDLRWDGVVAGNLVATDTLLRLLVSLIVLLGLTVLVPLARSGRGARIPAGTFVAGAYYFSAIGLAFMLVQMALVQRFSVLLGHPIWSLAVVLSSMILATGVGSLLSDRIELAPRRRLLVLPAGIAVAIVLAATVLRLVFHRVVGAPLSVGVATTLCFTVPLGLLLGTCFPIGIRLLRDHAEEALPWMWGLNGGFGVLGSVVAIVLAMTFGLSGALVLAALAYGSIVVPMAHMTRMGDAAGTASDTDRSTSSPATPVAAGAR